MAPNIPYAVSGVSEVAENFRRALATLISPFGGIGQPNSSWTTPMLCSATGTNLIINVAPGEIWVPNSLSSPKGGLYYCLNDASYAINLSTPPAALSGDTGVPWTGWSAPSAGNSQIIDICAVVFDTDYGYSYTGMHASPWAEFWLMPVFGTAAASPSPPTVPSNAVVLSQFTVTNSTTVITNAMLTDFRFPAGLGNVPGAVPVAGSIRYYGGTPVPPGWALEDGSTYQASRYPAAAAALAISGAVSAPFFQWDQQYFNNHGSYPATGFFAVPDSRGRGELNAGAGPGLTSRTFGTTVGSETVALSVGNLATHGHVDSGHIHSVTDPTHIHGVTDPTHIHTGIQGTDDSGTNAGWIAVKQTPSSLGLQGGGVGQTTWDSPAAIKTGPAGTGIAATNSGSTGITGTVSSHANNANTGSGTPFSIMDPKLVVTRIIRLY